MGLEKFGTNPRQNVRMRSVPLNCDNSGASRQVDYTENEENIITSSSMIQWSDAGDDCFYLCGATRPTLPAGAYTPVFHQLKGPGVEKKILIADELIDFPGSLTYKIIQEIAGFWDLGQVYRRMGFLHRRGYFFYGSQGTGKSCTIQQIVNNIIQQGYLAFFCENPQIMVVVLSQLRKIEPDRPIICVFEDIDSLIEKYGESDLLQWLDGADQIDRLINIASTNYPEVLDPRIVARPRRFDQLIEIEELPEPIRRTYLKSKLIEASNSLSYDPDELDLLVERTVGLPFAALAELMIALKCHGMDLETTLARLFSMVETRPHVLSSRSPLGFGNGDL